MQILYHPPLTRSLGSNTFTHSITVYHPPPAVVPPPFRFTKKRDMCCNTFTYWQLETGNWRLVAGGYSTIFKKTVDIQKIKCYSFIQYFSNAMKELRVFGLAFQRADVWCKSVRCKNSVSFRSRVPQPFFRVRSYGGPVTMATGFIKSPNE